MNFLFYFICGGIILSLGFYVVGSIEYKNYIKKMARDNTFEKIDSIINTDRELVEKGIYKGQMLNDLLDHIEVWEQIKEQKLKNEDTVS